jgi:hypothetical protein
MKRTITAVALFAFALPLFATVRGKVVRADGNPYPGVEITVEHTNGRTFTGYTDNDGMFYVHDVPAGEAKLRARTPRDDKKFQVSVTPQPYTDVAPIVVR